MPAIDAAGGMASFDNYLLLPDTDGGDVVPGDKEMVFRERNSTRA